MPNLIELTAQIVSSHAKNKSMSTEELIQDLQQVHNALQSIETGAVSEPLPEAGSLPPALTIRQAFKKDEVVCMVCQKGGFKTLKKHLATAHQLTPGQYRKQFGIKSTQKLAAKSFSEERSRAALDRGMVDILAKARETRMANIAAKKSVPALKAKAGVPVAKKKAAVPAVKVKPPVPAVKAKAAAPAVKVKAGVPVAAKKAPAKNPGDVEK